MDFRNAFYRYKEIFSNTEDGYDDYDDRRFKKIYDDLLSFERFSVILQEPEEAKILPAWVNKYKIKSNDKTIGKDNNR